MTVALTENAMQFEEGLRQRGYRVVAYGRYRGAIDAVVYAGAQMDSIRLSNSNFGGHSGVLLIDCTGHTLNDLDYYLQNRAFSSIL